MKTTVEIPDLLLREGRKLATREGVSLETLIERGLRQIIAEAERDVAFKLRRASFKGKGLRPDLRYASWERLRGLAYESRGGDHRRD